MSEQTTEQQPDNLQDRLAELEAKLEATYAHKERVLDEKKAEQAGRRELEAELAKFRAAEKEREDAEAAKRGEYEKLIAERDRHNADLSDKLRDMIKTTALNEALSSVEIAPAMRRGVEAMHREAIDIIDGKAVINGEDPTDYFKKWAETDEGKAYTVAKNTGGGAVGSTSSTPTLAGKANLGGSKAERVAALKARFPDLNG
jgi:hypothetical protein